MKKRSAFTLVELLVVIVVISILMALLVPAIMGARRRAQVAKVAVDIKQIEAAIGAFKVKYGVEPPSQFVIHITRTGWDNDAPGKAFVRRIWPQFDFDMGASTLAIDVPPGFQFYPPAWTADRSMNSGECLMFFLGGVIDTNNVPSGFSKNPKWPFNPIDKNREGPFLEFDVARIKDSDGNQIPEYYDALPESHPLLYFSSYEGRGYRPIELPVSGTAYTGLHDVYRIFKGTGTPPAVPAAPLIPPSNAAQPGTSNTLSAHKPQTCQIISAGFDGLYGEGGVYNPDAPNGGLSNRADYDNVTNFTAGPLVP